MSPPRGAVPPRKLEANKLPPISTYLPVGPTAFVRRVTVMGATLEGLVTVLAAAKVETAAWPLEREQCQLLLLLDSLI